MAVLPWAHSRSRTTSNEKRQKSALEWFSRSGGSEPSRQALTLMMKEHSRTTSSGSASLQSRSSTAQSHRSKQSQSSQLTSVDGEDRERHDASSRPQTPQLPEIRPLSPSYSLSATLDLFSMSNGLRRKNSTMSMRSETSASGVLVSPARLTPSRLGFRKRDPPTSPTRTAEGKPVPISQPFAFQHITHSEQSHFNGLSRIDESELASQFGAVQASQQPELGLRGIQADKLPHISDERSCSPTPQPKAHQLPMTPPRPSPPPKNSPPTMTALPRLEVRMSRSMENFSRPTLRSPITTPSASPKHLLSSQLPDLKEADEPATKFGKPLPHPPALIHAVSTGDNSAQCIKSMPLPSPPLSREFEIPHPPQSPPRGSLRHMSTFPSARHQQRFSIAVDDDDLSNIKRDTSNLTRNRSEDALTKYTQRSSRTLLKLPKHEDWEDAIEYAWDHADDESMDADDSSDSTSTAANPVHRETNLRNHSPTEEYISAPSTPLMMDRPTDIRPLDPKLTNAAIEMDSSFPGEMYGLGIGTSSASLPRVHPALGITIPAISEDNDDYQLPRTTYSAISKSSSQESIILSIASSILNTQRSSKSSMSPSELSQLSECDEQSSTLEPTPSALLKVENEKAARPESTCVPLALLKGFANSEASSEPLPHEQHSQHNGFAKHSTVKPTATNAVVEEPSTTSPASSPRHQLPSATVSPRKRSSTQTSRRNGRASYSLFPAAQSTGSPPL